MKKQLIILAIIATLATAWYCGRANGIAHAITSSEIWYTSDGFEIELDGQVYLHNAD